ncbi:MAG: nickel-dependent hydrogenase large subunit [Candidatus Omnitrophota bacterium]
MAKQTISIDPVTRIEGHLKIEVDIDNGVVVDARSSGTLWRGIEVILKGRDPRDAQHITQRICGVCPIGHCMASTFNLDSAFGVRAPANGRIIRNLILGANFIQSHILHFYHLAALDFVVGPDIAPFIPRYKGDYLLPKDINDAAVKHYLEALDIRMKAHELLAIWGGKAPTTMSVTPGGVTEKPTVDKIASSLWRIRQLQEFIDTVYVPDVLAIADVYEDYKNVGVSYKNFLSYGAFDLNEGVDSAKFIKRGRFTDSADLDVNPELITEDVKFSWYKDEIGRKNPKQGITEPDPYKDKAYSWLKAPRYDGIPHEVGPLARMWVSNEYRHGASLLDRHAARALETAKIAHAMEEWLLQLRPGEPVFTPYEIPQMSEGMGLTEAPRGALGHWIRIENKKIANYQCIVPTTWNCSPRDEDSQRGAVEESLIGTPVADADNPIEIVRVVRSFDPCLACAIHLTKPSGEIKKFRVC